MAIALIERYRPRHVLIEDAMTGSALADEVKCKFPSVVARTKPEGDKQVRLFVQSAKFEQGRVWFPKDLLGEEGFLAEFNGREVQARCVVMATGLIDERPPVQGLHRSGRRGRHSLLSHLRWLRSYGQEDWGSRHDASGRQEGPLSPNLLAPRIAFFDR